MIEDVIREESPSWVNANIDRKTLEALDRFRDASPERIQERLHELGCEYDLNSAATTVFSALGLAGVAMASRDRRWLSVPAIANGLLLLHNLPIPSPITPLFRLFGFRSQTEIERELYALKMMRGDYRRAEHDPTAKGAMTSAQSERGMIEGSGYTRVTGGPRPPKRRRRNTDTEAETEPLGEELRPTDAPTVSGPSGDPSRRH